MKRLKELQTASPVDMVLEYEMEGNSDLENYLHKLFEPYHIQGEWYRFDPIIKDFISYNFISKKFPGSNVVERKQGKVNIERDDVSTTNVSKTPLETGINMLFENDCENENYLTVSEVNNLVKEWSLWAYKNGKISREHKRPSTYQIKRAMNNAGYDQIVKRLKMKMDIIPRLQESIWILS